MHAYVVAKYYKSKIILYCIYTFSKHRFMESNLYTCFWQAKISKKASQNCCVGSYCSVCMTVQTVQQLSMKELIIAEVK